MIELQSSRRKRSQQRSRQWLVVVLLLGLVALWWRGPIGAGLANVWWTITGPLWRWGVPDAPPQATIDAAQSPDAQLQRCRADFAALQASAQDATSATQLAQSPWLKNALAASVVRLDATSAYRTAVISLGAGDGVQLDMPVMSASGLVGRVIQVAPHVANVLLLVDPLFAADVVVTRSQARGVLTGRGDALRLGRPTGISRMEYLEGHSDIREGDFVTTSGLDALYPAGLPVGVIHKVQQTDEGLITSAEIVPFVDWTNIRRVWVLPKRHAIPVQW